MAIPNKTTEQNDRLLVDSWNESLFAKLSIAQPHRRKISAAHQRVQQLDRLTLLAQQMAGKIELKNEIELARAAEKLPQGYEYNLLARVKKARQRVSVSKKLEHAMRDASSEALIVAAWRSVLAAQCEHFFPEKVAKRVILAERRVNVICACA